jgi:hypothetical protein
MSKATYQREVAIITINDSKIQDVKFGFQIVSLYQGFFDTKPKGDLRLNYGLLDESLNEIFKVGELQNIGNGQIVITGLNFPEDNIWEARFEIKDKNFNLLNNFCTKIKFEVNNNVKQISQEKCYF